MVSEQGIFPVKSTENIRRINKEDAILQNSVCFVVGKTSGI
jgi:hypothetical protein